MFKSKTLLFLNIIIGIELYLIARKIIPSVNDTVSECLSVIGKFTSPVTGFIHDTYKKIEDFLFSNDTARDSLSHLQYAWQKTAELYSTAYTFVITETADIGKSISDGISYVFEHYFNFSSLFGFYVDMLK